MTQTRETHFYQGADGRQIEVDVMGAHPGARKACVLWIHGGGLIFGSRTVSPRASFTQALLDRDFVIVSIDHRLAPETKLPGILDDVIAAWRWLHDAGAGLLGVDATRLVMAGASAGAYLSLLAGSSVQPRPLALASFWGFGDITAPWEAEPSQHYREMGLVAREDALASLKAPPVQDPSIGADRSVFYVYCRQQGLWLEEVTAHDPRADAGWFDRYCPSRNVTETFPPTVLVHGTQDSDVPHEQSELLATRFAAAGVPHQFISLAGVGHGFAGAQPEEIRRTELAVAEFLRTHAQRTA